MTAVLVVGVPRSGTSWIGRVLGATPGAAYLGEPDNHEHVPFALRAKLGLPGRFYPRLEPGCEAPAYERLWQVALEGPPRGAPSEGVRRRAAAGLLRRAGPEELIEAIAAPARSPLPLRLAARLAVPERRPPGAHLVVKSVHAQLALDWLVERFPLRVALVLRQPLNVLSSWKEMGWLGEGGVLAELGPAAASLEEALGVEPLQRPTPLEEATELIGLLTAALVEAGRRHPGWEVVSHEALCGRPRERFAELAGALGLGWDDRVERLLDELDRPGSGYETARVASTLPEVWRRRLTSEEVDVASRVLDRFAFAPVEER